jgi:hypothetical protein
MMAANPVHAFVAFLRIPSFESHPAALQASLKERLEARARSALEGLPAADRVVLDADEGLAVILFGEATHALDMAIALHAHAGTPLQVGLSHGPLALTTRGDDARVFGDGLSAAAAAARFASPERILVTENFARVLQGAAPGRAADLATAGEFTDTRVRMHSFYTPDPQRGAVRRRRTAFYAVGGAVFLLLAGVLGRDIYQPLFQSRPAFVTLQVKPRGEVIVDGMVRGRIPPLTEIEVAPGKRFLQIRSPGAPTFEAQLDLKPGQRMTVKHTFVRTPEPRPDLWRDLKKRFGS